MASIQDNIDGKSMKINEPVKIGIIKSEYNPEITNALLESCLKTLKESGANESDIHIKTVPGAWELAMGCQKALKSNDFKVIITIGLILKGETPHFDFIAAACAQGIMEVSLKTATPIIFGVLTTNTPEQAKARIQGGNRGDKGVEIAQAAIQMINFD